MNKLYKYYSDYGRMGDIEGIFVASDDEIRVKSGKPAYMGEMLGKHSEIRDDDWESNLTILTDDQKFIDKFLEIKAETGVNPLHYIADE